MQKRYVYPFARPPPGRTVLTIIDMQESCRGRLDYSCGSVEDGIRRTASMAAAFRRAGRPIALISNESPPFILREILEAAGPDPQVFIKSLQSAFTCIPFRRFLDDSQADALFVAGWVRSICVRDTLLDAVWEGYRVIACEELLFHRKGHPMGDALMPHERLFLQHAVDYCETAGEARIAAGLEQGKKAVP